MSFVKAVAKIQQSLKAPKSQTNKFGNYKYRNCEDILEALKPLLGDLTLSLSDEVVEVGGRIYVKATATLRDGNGALLVNTAFAREPDEQKGMSASQLTGTASSYARKYALNGLFLIDDTKDADTNEFKGEVTETKMVVTKSVNATTISPTATATSNDTDGLKKTVESTPATPVKKSGPWGAKKAAVTAPQSGGDLY